jgi:hypothetical protein
VEAVVASRHACKVNIAARKALRHSVTTFFHEVNFDAGMAAPVPGDEFREEILHDLRCRADAEYSSRASLERACALAKRLGFRQKPAAAPKEVLAFGREPDAAANAIEERHAELRFERVDLPGQGRLAQMQGGRGARKTTEVRNRGEGT